MASRGRVKHFGLWVTREEKAELMAVLERDLLADDTPDPNSSRGTDWKVTILSAKYKPGSLSNNLALNSKTYTVDKPGYIFLLVEIEVKNMNDLRRTKVDTSNFLIADSEENTTGPTGMYDSSMGLLEGGWILTRAPGDRDVSLTCVYVVDKAATGLKLCALGVPDIPLPLK